MPGEGNSKRWGGGDGLGVDGGVEMTTESLATASCLSSALADRKSKTVTTVTNAREV